MEAVARECILALQELDATHLRHDDDGATHPAVRAGAAADRVETLAERRLETHRAAMALASPSVWIAHHVACVPVLVGGRDHFGDVRGAESNSRIRAGQFKRIRPWREKNSHDRTAQAEICFSAIDSHSACASRRYFGARRIWIRSSL